MRIARNHVVSIQFQLTDIRGEVIDGLESAPKELVTQ